MPEAPGLQASPRSGDSPHVLSGMCSRASWPHYPAAFGDAFGQGTKIAVTILHRRHMAADSAVGRLEEEYRLAGLLGHGHQAAVMLCRNRG